MTNTQYSGIIFNDKVCYERTKTRKEIRTMKKATRILAFILACLMLSAVLVACNTPEKGSDETVTDEKGNVITPETKPGGSTNNTETGGEDETGTGEGETDIPVTPPPIEKTNYEADFQFLIMDDIFRTDYFYASEQTQEVMNNAIFTRQEEVYNHIGVTILGKPHHDYTQYKTDFEVSIKAGDNMYQSCLTHVTMDIAAMVTTGLLADYNDFDKINLDQPYWNSELMNSLAINDEIYLGYGDFCLASTYVIAYSKTLLDKYCGTALGDSTIYDIVNNKQWTLDKMIELASMSFSDTVPGTKDPKEVYGISGLMWVPAISFVHASGLNICEYNSAKNKYEFTFTNAAKTKKMEELVSKMKELYAAEYSYFWGPFEAASTDPSKQVTLKGNNTLFSLTGTYGLMDLVDNNVEDFGVLPYPMWDEAQGEYRHLSWNGYIAIPHNVSIVSDDQMVGETLELLGYYSKPVTEAFYEKLLGAQISESPDDADMLKIVWNTQVSDYGMAYSSYGSKNMDTILYGLPQCVLGVNSYSTFAGLWAKVKSSVTKDLNQLQAKKKA